MNDPMKEPKTTATRPRPRRADERGLATYRRSLATDGARVTTRGEAPPPDDEPTVPELWTLAEAMQSASRYLKG